MAKKKKTRRPIKQANWHKDAIIYQLHVRAFHDSNGDGIGDFRGLSRKMDYLEDLGVNALWLLPFYVSPLRDDGYDIADYVSVHPSYGTLRDFKIFLDEAHKRGIRVITELVLNHTSDQHKWFQRARQAKPGSRYRDWYVWSDTPEKYTDARIIFRDFEPSNWTWDAEAGAYFWHRFYSHQPDLNFESPAVRRAVTKVMDTWFDMGVDGLRLDAIPYLFEREGTSCENLPETHQFLKDLRSHTDQNHKDRVFLAEANQWPEDTAAYFGEGNECHMAFHFPLMPRLFMALRREDRFPIVDILEQTPEIPENCQWALFLRNHDELTLEMVTDAERDYMYRTYGRDPRWRINLGIRRRLAPLLENSRRRIELMTSLLFALPGSPIIYYGDEIGMGDNVYLGDRNGVRTPMQWSCDRNAGFSQADPQSLYFPVITTPEYHYETINVETQQGNPQSLLWWYKRLIALRKQHKVLGRGSLQFLHPQNSKVLAFLRRDDDETILVVANLSRFMQPVELSLGAFEDHTPVELFGQVSLPPIGEDDYLMTLGPHSIYWFKLRPPKVSTESAEVDADGAPVLKLEETWTELFEDGEKEKIETLLADYLPRQRWFGGKGRDVRHIRLAEVIEIPYGDKLALMTLIEMDYKEGDPETYVLAFTAAHGEEATILQHESEVPIFAQLDYGEDEDPGVLYDAIGDPDFALAVLEFIGGRRRFKGQQGRLVSRSTQKVRQVLDDHQETPLVPVLPKAEQSNSSILYRDEQGYGVFILKFYRRLDPGVNPDVELIRFLTNKARFEHVPAYSGALEFEPERDDLMTVAMLQSFQPNEGDAWAYTLQEIGAYFEQVSVKNPEFTPESFPTAEPDPSAPSDDDAETETPSLAQELIGDYLYMAKLLGQRTGEMHVALAGDTKDKQMAPERFMHFHRDALHHEVLSRVRGATRLVQRRKASLAKEVQPLAEKLGSKSSELRTRLNEFKQSRFSTKRTRIHGDYHLGQVLFTGKDFVIIDFEGEPAIPLSERLIKRSPMKDVAGMLRSFHYAAQSPLVGHVADPVVRDADRTMLETAAEFWYRWVGAMFLSGYREVVDKSDLLPKADREFQTLLDAYLLDKAGYELTYELNNRPGWVSIPLKGMLQLLEGDD